MNNNHRFYYLKVDFGYSFRFGHLQQVHLEPEFSEMLHKD